LIPDHGGLAGLGDDDHVQYVLKSTWDAYSILAADVDDTPAAVTLAVSEMIGRKATGGIVALAKADILTILNVADGADVTGDIHLKLIPMTIDIIPKRKVILGVAMLFNKKWIIWMVLPLIFKTN